MRGPSGRTRRDATHALSTVPSPGRIILWGLVVGFGFGAWSRANVVIECESPSG